MGHMGSETPLERHGLRTVHAQLQEKLRQFVVSAQPGQQIPTEQELTEMFGVSRSTVRRALQAFIDDGTLVRRQGKGTFISATRLVQPLDHLRPFISMFTAAGKYPEGTVLDYRWIADPALVPTPARDEGHLLVRRLYRLNGVPQAIADIFVPASLGRRISREDIEEHPIYEVLQSHLGVSLHHADIVIAARGAGMEEAGPLECPVGSPLLLMQRTTYDNHGEVVESALYYLPASMFELRLTVQAQEMESQAYSFSRPELVLTEIPTGPDNASERSGSELRARSESIDGLA